MALCRLAADWAQARGGQVTALTVDHGLRPESAAECRRVADWMQRAGIEHHVLPWVGPKPVTGIQQAARDERYRLLLGWCREAAVLHLLLGHHRRDQAETVLFRLLRGSGPTGLAGMAAVVETAHVRLLRPLLDWSPELLRVLLRRWGWEWLDDPSNDDRRFARARLRQAVPSLAAFGVTTEALLELAADAAAARAAMQEAVAELITAACNIHPAGFVRLDRGILAAAPAEVAAMAVANIRRRQRGCGRHWRLSPAARHDRRRSVAAASSAAEATCGCFANGATCRPNGRCCPARIDRGTAASGWSVTTPERWVRGNCESGRSLRPMRGSCVPPGRRAESPRCRTLPRVPCRSYLMKMD